MPYSALPSPPSRGGETRLFRCLPASEEVLVVYSVSRGFTPHGFVLVVYSYLRNAKTKIRIRPSCKFGELLRPEVRCHFPDIQCFFPYVTPKRKPCLVVTNKSVDVQPNTFKRVVRSEQHLNSSQNLSLQAGLATTKLTTTRVARPPCCTDW